MVAVKGERTCRDDKSRNIRQSDNDEYFFVSYVQCEWLIRRIFLRDRIFIFIYKGFLSKKVSKTGRGVSQMEPGTNWAPSLTIPVFAHLSRWLSRQERVADLRLPSRAGAKSNNSVFSFSSVFAFISTTTEKFAIKTEMVADCPHDVKYFPHKIQNSTPTRSLL